MLMSLNGMGVYTRFSLFFLVVFLYLMESGFIYYMAKKEMKTATLNVIKHKTLSAFIQFL